MRQCDKKLVILLLRTQIGSTYYNKKKGRLDKHIPFHKKERKKKSPARMWPYYVALQLDAHNEIRWQKITLDKLVKKTSTVAIV